MLHISTEILLRNVMSLDSSQRVQPLLSGWLVSISTLLISIFVVYFSVIGSEYGRRSHSFSKARNAAIDGNFSLVEHLMQNGLKREGISRYLPSSFSIWDNNRTYTEATLKRFVDLVKLVKQEKLSAAGELFRELAPDIAVSADGLGEPVDQLLTKIDKQMALAIEGYLRKRESASELVRAETKRDSNLETFTSVQKELATLLGVPTNTKLGKDHFYNEGVLKDLPVISLLPDNITDLPSLGAHLKNINASVQTPEGVNAHQYFLDNLEEIKTRSFAVKLQLESSNQKISDLTSKIAIGNQKLTEAAPYLVKQFTGVLLIASRNTIQEGGMLPFSIREVVDNYLH